MNMARKYSCFKVIEIEDNYKAHDIECAVGAFLMSLSERYYRIESIEAKFVGSWFIFILYEI